MFQFIKNIFVDSDLEDLRKLAEEKKRNALALKERNDLLEEELHRKEEYLRSLEERYERAKKNKMGNGVAPEMDDTEANQKSRADGKK